MENGFYRIGAKEASETTGQVHYTDRWKKDEKVVAHLSGDYTTTAQEYGSLRVWNWDFLEKLVLLYRIH